MIKSEIFNLIKFLSNYNYNPGRDFREYSSNIKNGYFIGNKTIYINICGTKSGILVEYKCFIGEKIEILKLI